MAWLRIESLACCPRVMAHGDGRLMLSLSLAHRHADADSNFGRTLTTSIHHHLHLHLHPSRYSPPSPPSSQTGSSSSPVPPHRAKRTDHISVLSPSLSFRRSWAIAIAAGDLHATSRCDLIPTSRKQQSAIQHALVVVSVLVCPTRLIIHARNRHVYHS
jgi:hypothetical protein